MQTNTDIDDLLIRPMTRDELNTLVDWAAREGWNPGLHDADVFWQTDPDGFIAAELNGELIGGGSIVTYGGQFGFMGFFIVKPEYRGKGLGTKLWFARRRKLESRLRDPVCIGMDGVFEMQPFYTKGGFKFSHRDIRFQGTGKAGPLAASLVSLDQVPFDTVLDYDGRHFPAQRAAFLEGWISQPESRALGVIEQNALQGYGVIRRCQTGFKIGPLFADNDDIARDLFDGLSHHAAGEPLFLDVPEINAGAIKIARDQQMEEVFGCARMYFGTRPELPDEQIYGVTTFELG